MIQWQPEDAFRQALTKLDLDEADMIVTPEAAAAEWARERGYRVSVGEVDGMAVYEIKSGDQPAP